MVAKVEEVQDSEEEEINAQHLLVAFQGSAANVEGARTKEEARAFIEDLKGKATPENFAILVQDNSDEPGASETSGDLGYFTEGAMVPEFEEAVFAQETGTISDVVETAFGFHLIYKKDSRLKKNIRLRIIEINRTVETDIVPLPEPWKSTEFNRKTVGISRRGI